MCAFVSRQRIHFLVAFLVFLVACGGSEVPAASPTETPAPTAIPQITEAAFPTDTPRPTETPPPTTIPQITEAALPTDTPRPTETPSPTIIDDYIDAGGRKLHYVCMGDGYPTVLLEAGWTAPAGSWSMIQKKLASETTVCAYDRAGLGASDPAPQERRTVQDMADDLQLLLDELPVPGPYVMAGHSLGGFILRVYRDQHPDQVLGMVLADTSVADLMDEPIISYLPPLAEDDPDWVQQFYTGVGEYNWFWFGCAEKQPLLDRLGGAEPLDWCQSVTIVRQSGDLGSIPLVVMARDPEMEVALCVNEWETRAGDDQERLEVLCRIGAAGWSAAQQELAELSNSGRMEIVANSTHSSVVWNIDAVLLEVIEQVKQSE